MGFGRREGRFRGEVALVAFVLLFSLLVGCTKREGGEAQAHGARSQEEEPEQQERGLALPPCERGYEGEGLLLALRSRERELDRCYAPARRRRPELEGSLLLSLTLSSSGQVESARVELSTLGEEALHDCVLTAARAWRLPVEAGSEAMTVHHLIVFAPSAGSAPPAPEAPAAGQAGGQQGGEERGEEDAALRAVVDRVFGAHLGEVFGCYVPMTLLDPALSGNVVARYTLSEEGRVQSVELRSERIQCPVLEDCLEGAMQRWTFPPREGGGAASVEYLFTLGPMMDPSEHL